MVPGPLQAALDAGQSPAPASSPVLDTAENRAGASEALELSPPGSFRLPVEWEAVDPDPRPVLEDRLLSSSLASFSSSRSLLSTLKARVTSASHRRDRKPIRVNS
jgi:hypothetical protein